MSAEPIAHIGVLVSDVTAARANWSRALGGTFSPIVRYRPAEWRFQSKVCDGSIDLRQTIYIGVSPSIEIQQFVSNGTRAAEGGQGVITSGSRRWTTTCSGSGMRTFR
jgi:hypothetical protein